MALVNVRNKELSCLNLIYLTIDPDPGAVYAVFLFRCDCV